MKFLKRHYKTTTLLILALLFAYVSHLRDNLHQDMKEVVCWIRSESQHLIEDGSTSSSNDDEQFVTLGDEDQAIENPG